MTLWHVNHISAESCSTQHSTLCFPIKQMRGFATCRSVLDMSRNMLRLERTFVTAVIPDGEDVESSPQILCTAVSIEVYRAGIFSYKGTRDKYSICQVYPAVLSERRNIYDDICSTSSSNATCVHRDDSLLLQTDLMLPDLSGLPLAAEPPLYINMTSQNLP